MARKAKAPEAMVNVVHYDSYTGVLSVYDNVPAWFRYNKLTIRDPETDSLRDFYIRGARDGEISIGERASIVWSKKPIDVDNFKRIVWNDRLEQYGHMVSDALALIRKKKTGLDIDAKALLG